jgi:hypothetical protein
MTSHIRVYLKKNWLPLLLSVLFGGWASAFIYHSSYVASDGRLYFNLFDDAMISMRYGWNLAHGRGLVWNAGDVERVEGYTNLLMTLVMSVATFLFDKRYAVFAIQLTGIFFMLGTAWMTVRIGERVFQNAESGFGMSDSGLHRYLPFVLILLYYPLNFWSLMGMETGMLAFFLTTGILLSLKYTDSLNRPNSLILLMAGSFGLAFLTRNDSLVFAALSFLFLLPTLKHGRRDVYLFLAAGVLYSAFILGQTAFRYFYYGEIMPNTYTLKLVGMALDERLRNGWGFISPFLKETGALLLVALAGLTLRFSWKRLYLFGFFLVSVLYQVYVGGDAWNYWRIMAPTMPLLLLLFSFACFEIVERFSQTGWIRNFTLAALSIFALYVADARFVREFLLLDLPYQNNYAQAHVEAAIAINDLTKEDATIGVFWGGTLPYYVDRTAIDFLGKSDKYIASLPPDVSGQSAGFGMNSMPGHNKYDLTYSIQKLLPTYVEEFDWGTQKLSGWAEEYYVRVKYNDAKLYLLKGSPDIDWDKVTTILAW